MKTIKGDLILTENTTFEEAIAVEGNIKGDFNLKVAGNIDAMDIDAMDIDAGNIDAMDINAMDIDAGNIDARDIICQKRIKKSTRSKTVARIFIQDRSKFIIKEWE